MRKKVLVRRLSGATAMMTLLASACTGEAGKTENARRNVSRSQTSGKVAPEQREAALAAARVWSAPGVAIGAADFRVNTTGPGGFEPTADVDCTVSLEPSGGMTPKFRCTLPEGDDVKVKYSEGVPNGEIPAEIAATRLLTALGFPTDRMNKVHSVRCHGCPPLPQQAMQCLEKGEPAAVCLQGAAPDRIVTFEDALIERPIEGQKIEATKDQGWSFYELDKIDPRAGGSSRAEVDALRLMAVLLAHWDNKGANQKLLCPPGASRPDGSCRAPVAAIGDLGATFGPYRVDLVNWKKVPMWADPASCTVSMKGLPYDGATFKAQHISEPGRQFTLHLLRQLTPAQLNTLFEASGVTAFPHIAAAAKEPQHWTDAFLDKVNQIERAGPCK